MTDIIKQSEERLLFSESQQKEIIRGKKTLRNEKTNKTMGPGGGDLEKFINLHREKINHKFCDRMKKLVKFFEIININFDDLQDENPINLLMKLTEIKNCYERNQIIEKIDIIINNM